jgi:hypothetical protein
LSGQCHIQFDRVIATNSILSPASNTSPFGLRPFEINTRAARRGYIHKHGRLVVNAGLSLVREVQVAVFSKREIVDSFEAFRKSMSQEPLDPAGFRIENHDAQAIVGDENAAIAVDR